MIKKNLLTTLTLLMLFTMMFNVFVYAADLDEWPLSVRIDNVEVDFPDAKPFIDYYGRTQVPIRFIAEALGAEAEMLPGTTTVVIKKDDKEIILKIGFKEIVVDGVTKVMDCSPIIKDSRTFVPVRFVAEELGVLVEWEDLTNTVFITTPENDHRYKGYEELRLPIGTYDVVGFKIEHSVYDYGEQRTPDTVWMQRENGLIISQAEKDRVTFAVCYYGNGEVERYHNYEKQVKELEQILLQKLSKETVSRIINKIMECRLEVGEELLADDAKLEYEDFVEGDYIVWTVFIESGHCTVEFFPVENYPELID